MYASEFFQQCLTCFQSARGFMALNWASAPVPFQHIITQAMNFQSEKAGKQLTLIWSFT